MQNYHNLRKLARKYRKILHKTRNLCKNVPPYHPLPPFIRQNIWPYQIISVPLHPKTIHRGVEQLVARQAHNLEVACSSPAPATKAWFPQAFFVGSPLHMLPVAVLGQAKRQSRLLRRAKRQAERESCPRNQSLVSPGFFRWQPSSHAPRSQFFALKAKRHGRARVLPPQ